MASYTTTTISISTLPQFQTVSNLLKWDKLNSRKSQAADWSSEKGAKFKI